jgi:hypothetical protein
MGSDSLLQVVHLVLVVFLLPAGKGRVECWWLRGSDEDEGYCVGSSERKSASERRTWGVSSDRITHSAQRLFEGE